MADPVKIVYVVDTSDFDKIPAATAALNALGEAAKGAGVPVDDLARRTRKAATDAETSAEKQAGAAEKASERAARAAEKQAAREEAAIDKAVTAELKAAEKQIAAQDRAALAAQKAAEREEAAWAKASQAAIWAAEKQQEAVALAAAKEEELWAKAAQEAIWAAEKQAEAQAVAAAKATAAAEKAAAKQAAALEAQAIAAKEATSELQAMAVGTDKLSIAAERYRQEQIKIAGLSAAGAEQVAVTNAQTAAEERLAVAKAEVAAETKSQSLLYGDISGPIEDMAGGMMGIAFAAGIAVTAVAGLGKEFYGIVESVTAASGEMEGYETRLAIMMGSTAAAKDRLAELFDYASHTKFNVQQVVAADVALRGFGADAKALMPGLLDFASVLGQDLPEAAIAIGKAYEFGGKSLRSDAGKILKAQIEITTGLNVATASIKDFRKALLTTLNTDPMFAGGAAKIAETYTGMISNLQDDWMGFKVQIGDAGLFNNVKGALAETLDLISKNKVEVGHWASAISSGLWGGIKLVGEGAAYILDTFAALGQPIDEAKVSWEEFAATALESYAQIDDAIMTVNRTLGIATKGGEDFDRSLHSAAIAARAFANDSRANLSMAYGNSAVNTVDNFFTNAEDRAKQYGSVLEDVAQSARDAANAGSGSGKKDKKEKEVSIKDSTIEDELKAAAKFQSDLTEMALKGERDRQEPVKQTTKEVWLELQERLKLENTYEQDGVYSYQEGADARVQIYHEYSRKIENIAQQDLKARLKILDTEHKALIEKGKKDSEELKQEAEKMAGYRDDIIKGGVQLFDQVMSVVIDTLSSAATEAANQVSALDGLISGLQDTTVDAAKLSGKALVKAYKDGKVAAADLSDSQKLYLEKDLKREDAAAKKRAAIKKEEALGAWRAQQAVSIAMATIQGIMAVTNALATVPYPAAPAAAVAAGIAAASDVVAIATQKPPSFRAGGLIGADIGMRAPTLSALPDVRNVSMEAGEGALTRQGVAAEGGEQGLRDRNAGIPAAPFVVNFKLRHQLWDQMTAEQLQRNGSLRKAVSTPTTRGVSNFYRSTE